MPHKRKATHCRNCGHLLAPEDNYCPRCGQENDDRNVSIWALGSDYLEETVGIDSKLLRSLIPFVLVPGKLALAFVSGQRKRYLSPVRIYLTMSVIFFLTLQWDLGSELESNLKTDKQRAESILKEGLTLDSLRVRQQEILAAIELKGSSEDTAGMSSLLKDQRSTARKIAFIDTISFQISGMFELRASKKELLDTSITDLKLLQTKQMEDTWLNRRFIAQARKIAAAEEDASSQITSFLTDNASIAGFIMVPLFALFLKLIFWRRRIHYVAHLVFVLYEQSFVFLLTTILMAGISLTRGTELALQYWYGKEIVAVLCLIHGYMALKHVYKNNWWQSIFITMGAFVGWLICLVVVIIPLAALSFLFF